MDTSHGQKMKINVDFSFPKLPCLCKSAGCVCVLGCADVAVTCCAIVLSASVACGVLRPLFIVCTEC